MKKFLKTTGIAALAAFALTFSSCNVEPAYTLENLQNIDLNVTLFQNGIQLRLADSSSVFRVDTLMKSVGLDSSEFIKQGPDGSYYISYSDSMDLTEDISGIGLDEVITIDAVNFNEDISYNLEGFDLANLLAIVPPELQGEYTIPDIHYDIDKTVDIELLSGQDLPEMLVGVGDIVLDNVYTTVELLFTDLPGQDTQEYDLDATVTLPAFFDPTSIELKGKIKKNEVFSRNVKINKFNLSAVDFVAMRENNTTLSDQIVINGTVAAENVVVNLAGMGPTVNGTIGVAVADANGKILVKSIQAKIDYQMNQTFTSAFFALPEAFSDATIELPDATVDLTVKTNMALPLAGSADLKAQGAAAAVATINFEVPYSLDPSVFEEKTSHNTVSLNDLLEEAADSLDFVTSIATDKNTWCYIEPAAEYGMQLDIDLSLPLAFGAGTLIHFADTLEIGADTGKQIGQILQESSIGVKAHVTNTIPISADVTIKFLGYDEANGTYTAIPLNSPVSIQLPAPGEEGLLNIEIGAEKGNTALEKLTHMELGIDVHANGQALKGEDYIVLTDIYLLLPNGVHLDGNTLLDQEENENE
ncbi:MAG: hypothetical protein J6037_05670 [Bacteroidales bacterium]|nr:hypothetical protein [Bacteroidales bacterium]